MAVYITTYGVLHGAPPDATSPVRVDLTTALRNPASDPRMIEMTGLDRRVRDHVMGTDGARQILGDALAGVEAALAHTSDVEVLVFCRGGRHRSVAMGEEIADHLTRQRVVCQVTHRDVGKAVVR